MQLTGSCFGISDGVFETFRVEMLWQRWAGVRKKTPDINCLFANQICNLTVGFHYYLALKYDGYFFL